MMMAYSFVDGIYARLELGHTLYIALTTEDTHRSRARRNMSSKEQLEGEPNRRLAARWLGGSAATTSRHRTVHGQGLIGATLLNYVYISLQSNVTLHQVCFFC